MRTAIAITCLIVYVLVFNYYIQTLGIIPIRFSKLVYNYTTCLMVVFLFLEESFGYVTYLHKQLNKVAKMSLIFNYVIIIFTHQLIISDPTNMLLIFNGSIFVTSLMILISAWQHGYFKQRYENE